MPIVTATRLVKFNAGHRVYNPAWSDERNQSVFGKCNNPNFHGHNYTLEITVEGTVDPDTGYVIDLGELKRIAEVELVQHLDHKNLNLDVPFLSGTIPTTENLIVACWKQLAAKVAPVRLVRLKLWETDNHYVEYDGR
jgi:6-pyruvoyltetrahydropterin/6-carboxytetrahydropterin synthase